MEIPFAEAYRIKMVEPLKKSTRAEREQWLKDAHYACNRMLLVISNVLMTMSNFFIFI